MGAPLSACTLALHLHEPIRNFVNMAGPFDFAKAGLFARWMEKRVFDVDKLIDTYGAMPAEMVRLGFKLLKPTMDLSTLTNLWWNAWNDRYVAGFKALNKWANDYVPLPGEFFRQWVMEAWSKVLTQAMGTENFAAALGKHLDQHLSAVGPVRKQMAEVGEEYLKALNLPSRRQVADLAELVVALESRIEALEEKIEAVLHRERSAGD